MKSKILLSFVLIFAFLFVGCNTDEDMQAQYEKGYLDAYNAGRIQGYNEGIANDPGNFTAYYTAKSEYYYSVTSNPLAIYIHPDYASEKIGEIPSGECYDAYFYQTNFAFIYFDGVYGWVPYYEDDDYEEYEEEEIVEEIDEDHIEDIEITYYVDTEETPLNIRSDPQQDSDILGQIPKGTNIVVCEIFDGYGYVVYDDIEGWVNLDYCTEGENPNLSEENSETVYVTDTGKKYHKDGCGYLSESKHPIDMDAAIAKGYDPCSRCY